MENKKVNAESVAPPVSPQYTTESTITVDGHDYQVTKVENTGVAPVWFIYVTYSSGERVKFSGLFRQFGFGAKIAIVGDAIVTPRNFDQPTLAGLIAAAIAYDNAEYAEYMRHELS